MPSGLQGTESEGAGGDSSISARLCGACGMCCDGVLFHSVELRADDNPRQLGALGLKIRRKKGVEFFLQPCAAHRVEGDTCSCAIYAERPTRCRVFNCRQILAVESGSTTEEDAAEKIRDARSLVARVLQIMGQVGETNPSRSLAHRVANALTMPEGTSRTPLHHELDSAMRELEGFLAKEFRI